ncbi:InlB B-repeat-containing protein [Paludibaculum fermentans]|uniref:InlB B-repeat-containing protein n=1 Tax=Paludibaculum fermentans TaxID=1473598 RepID=UPI003EB7DEFB
MEITALAGEIVVTCSGGFPTSVGAPVPTADIQIYFNTSYTGRTTGVLTESLLLIDEPLPANRVPCTTDVSLCGWTGGASGPNVYQAKVLGSNAITFQGIPFDPPGSGQNRVLRFTNIRVDASSLGISSTMIPISVYAFISVAGAASLPLANSQVAIGFVQKALNSAVMNSRADTVLPALMGVELPNCVSTTKQRFATLRFSKSFGTALLPRSAAAFIDTETSPTPKAQNAIGTIYNSETGFYSPAFPATNKLNTAGLADFGSRIQADFTNLPAGATLYVAAVPVTFTNGVPAPNGGAQLRARLISSATGAFAPVTATEILDGIPAAAIPITQGSAQAVWEVLQNNPGALDNVDFPLWISYPANTVGLGTASVNLRQGPVSTVKASDETAPVPQFVDAFNGMQLVTIRNMCPGDSYVVTSNPAGLTITVDGQPYTAPHSFNWQPKSTHTLSVTTPQFSSSTVRHKFLWWSDSGTATHTITAPDFPTVYTAGFNSEYQLTLSVSPPGGGTIAASPASADGFYAPDTGVTVTATPAAGYSFAGFTGSYTTTSNSFALPMTSPMNLQANFVSASGGVGVGTVTPDAGTGSTQTFTASFTGTQGPSSLTWVQMLIAAAENGGGQPFCLVHYDAHASAFWVYSDVDGFFHGPVAAHAPSGTLQGSSCALDTANSSATRVGNQLSVDFRLVFKSSAARKVYLRAYDDSGADTGSVQRGVWTQVPLDAPTMTVTPASGNSASPLFQAKFASDAYGNQGSLPLGWQQFLVAADSTGGGQPFCFVHYDRAGGAFWMYSSDVGFFLGPVAPGAASNTLDSSACTVNTAAAAAGIAGDFSSSLTLPLTLKAPMSGAKQLYMRTMDPLLRDSGWQQVGTYQVP